MAIDGIAAGRYRWMDESNLASLPLAGESAQPTPAPAQQRQML
jgi:protein involved in temperature-dependent protein secretion